MDKSSSPANRGLVSQGAMDLACLLLPALLLFAVASSQSRFSHHFRYVLPVEPFVLVACSSVLRPPGSLGRSRLAWFSAAAVCCECLSCFPHELSFYNTMAGGPQAGRFLLLGSNTDWGQDVGELRTWANRYRAGRSLHVALTRPGDATELPFCKVDPFPEDPERTDGLYAISVNFLEGERNRAPASADERFNQWPLVARIGHTIRIYQRPAPTP